MTREELFELMREAGFNTDWTGYENVQKTVAKYERLADLIERKVCSYPTVNPERLHHQGISIHH